MSLKKKTGIVLLICAMAAVSALVWYCLLTAGRGSAHLDGTFVILPPATDVREMAA